MKMAGAWALKIEFELDCLFWNWNQNGSALHLNWRKRQRVFLLWNWKSNGWGLLWAKIFCCGLSPNCKGHPQSWMTPAASLHLYLRLCLYLYLCIYMRVCFCVCVCIRQNMHNKTGGSKNWCYCYTRCHVSGVGIKECSGSALRPEELIVEMMAWRKYLHIELFSDVNLCVNSDGNICKRKHFRIWCPVWKIFSLSVSWKCPALDLKLKLLCNFRVP